MKRRKNENEFDNTTISLDNLPLKSTFNVDINFEISEEISFSSFFEDYQRKNKNTRSKDFIFQHDEKLSEFSKLLNDEFERKDFEIFLKKGRPMVQRDFKILSDIFQENKDERILNVILRYIWAICHYIKKINTLDNLKSLYSDEVKQDILMILKEFENLGNERIENISVYNLVSEIVLDLMMNKIFLNIFKIDFKKMIQIIYDSSDIIEFMSFLFHSLKHNSIKMIPFITNWIGSIEENEDVYFIFMESLLQFLKKEQEFEEIIIHLLIDLTKIVPNLIISSLPIIIEHKFTKPICRRYLVDLLGETISYVPKEYYNKIHHPIFMNLLKDKDSFIRSKSIQYLKIDNIVILYEIMFDKIKKVRIDSLKKIYKILNEDSIILNNEQELTLIENLMKLYFIISTSEKCLDTLNFIKEILCLKMIKTIPWKRLILLKEKTISSCLFYEKYFKNQNIQIEEIKNLMNEKYQNEEEINHLNNFFLIFQKNYSKEFNELFQLTFHEYQMNKNEKSLKLLFFFSQIKSINKNEREILYQIMLQEEELNLFLIKILIQFKEFHSFILTKSNEIINSFKKEGLLLIQRISKDIVFDYFIKIENQILKQESFDLNLLNDFILSIGNLIEKEEINESMLFKKYLYFLISIQNEMEMNEILKSSCLISLLKIMKKLHPNEVERIFSKMKFNFSKEEIIYHYQLLIFISNLIPIIQIEKRFSFFLYSSLNNDHFEIKKLSLILLGNLFLKRKIQIENVHQLFITLLDEDLFEISKNILSNLFLLFYENNHSILLNIFIHEKNKKIIQILYQKIFSLKLKSKVSNLFVHHFIDNPNEELSELFLLFPSSDLNDVEIENLFNFFQHYKNNERILQNISHFLKKSKNEIITSKIEILNSKKRKKQVKEEERDITELITNFKSNNNKLIL
eukprot:gene4163-7473_t